MKAMKPFELKQALEQGYAYTRDKKKIVDLKLSDYYITYRLTGRIEDNPECVKSWNTSGYCNNYAQIHALDLCYLEIETDIIIIVNDTIIDRVVDIEKLFLLMNLNTDYYITGNVFSIIIKNK